MKKKFLSLALCAMMMGGAMASCGGSKANAAEETAETADSIPTVYYIKDITPDIYCEYTGQSNALVLENLHLIAEAVRQSDCIVRIPLIPGYNTDTDRENSRKALQALGFTRFDLFTYQIRKH